VSLANAVRARPGRWQTYQFLSRQILTTIEGLAKDGELHPLFKRLSSGMMGFSAVIARGGRMAEVFTPIHVFTTYKSVCKMVEHRDSWRL
jgi:hypothetical protein